MRVAVVVGVGPGIGTAVAAKFASQGYSVALVARRLEKLTQVQKEFETKGWHSICVPADASSEESVSDAFKKIRETLGHPNVLVYNAAARRFKKQGIVEVTSEEFINFWKINCLGAFYSSRQVVPEMIKNKRGTILFTGATASMRALDGLSSFSVGKFGLRALAQSMARELGPQGIHVAQIIVDGKVDVPIVRHNFEKYGGVYDPSDWMSPESIAQQYWNIHEQDKSCWTFEMDLRPFTEPLAKV